MFLINEPAIIINKALVIADLHIGITRELYESGVSIPSQVKKMVDKIHRLKKMTGAEELVILGDIKHKVPGISWQELREIPEFLSSLNFRKIIIVKGNHDGDIEKMVPEALKQRVKVKKFFSIGNYFLTHGHRKVSTNKNIIIAHNHPHIRFRDRLGALYTEPCWVIGKIKMQNIVDVIIMPAFNELCGATVVNRDALLGPIAKKLINAHVHLLDGTDLGELKALKIKE
jgi:putative SbcD/Mre11-related phosphoesterase